MGKRPLNRECCRVVFDSEFHKKVNTECVYMERVEALQSVSSSRKDRRRKIEHR